MELFSTNFDRDIFFTIAWQGVAANGLQADGWVDSVLGVRLDDGYLAPTVDEGELIEIAITNPRAKVHIVLTIDSLKGFICCQLGRSYWVSMFL